MSKHYISCARCDKDIVIKTSNDCYSSEIDGKLLCYDCWQKEQLKFLSNKIADLETKLAEKDEELKEVKQHRTQILNFGKRTKKVVIVNPYGKDCVVYNQEDQDKIEFAIEQLEALRGNILCNEVFFDRGVNKLVDNEIDDMIKRLKEGKII